jgi:putative Mg2+ transporter-C (MgtC) family protein
MDTVFQHILSEASLLGKFVAALLLGGIVGWEREAQSKSAGLRTYMLITAAATAFVLLAIELTDLFIAAFSAETVTADPTRIVHAIVIGVSFIGAGAIMKNRNSNTVENLTTSAGILVMTAVGIAIALDAWFFAIMVSLSLLFINCTVLRVEHYCARKRGWKK